MVESQVMMMHRKKTRKNTSLLFFFIIASLLTISLLAGTVQAGTETIITTNASASNQNFPAISGTWIVWTDTRNDDGSGSSDIYAYNVITGAELRITPPGSYANYPAISGDTIVCQDYRNGNYDIYAYDLGTVIETRITDDPGNQEYPAMDGDLVVWQDDRNGDYDIYLFDLLGGTEQLLTPDTAGSDQTSPAISGNYVVWQDGRNGATGDIYLNDTATADLYNLNPGAAGVNHLLPAISGSRIVWQDSRNGSNKDIYLNDTTGESLVNDVVPGGSDKVFPSINGTHVIWIDNRNPGFNDIYLNDLTGADTRITNDLAVISTVDGAPKISGERVVWTDSRNGDNDIFMYTTGPDQTCPVADFTISPSHSGPLPFTVEFTDASTAGTTAISHWKWEFGDGNTSTQQNTTFTYTIPGNYDVRLTINNAYCRNETPVLNSYRISVGAAPVASFTTNTTSGMVPLTVKFTNTSVGATAWNWSFGDGTYSDLQSPPHTYATGGTYTVALNASNTYGYSFAPQTTIHALTGANEAADTTIGGISITTPFGSEFLTYDTTQLPGPVNTGTTLICTSPQLSGHGWQNITFISNDGIGFIPDGTLIKGNISDVTFLTKEINPAGFSTSTGALSSINYSIALTSYPVGATLNTQIWEGYIPADYTPFSTIAHSSGYSEMWGIAYTTKITRTNFPSSGTARLHMSVNSTWVSRFGGRDHAFIQRISDDRSTGEVLQTRFLYNDSVTNLDYFEADSPRGLSTFGLSQLSGSGNPFQMIYLGVAERVSNAGNTNDNTGDNTGDSSTTGTGSKDSTGKATENVVAAPPVAAAPPAVAPPAPDPGATALLSVNTQGVITQTTVVQSPDRIATVTLGQGIVALNAAGNPLASITISPAPPSSIHALPPGNTISFAGIGYQMQPDGATFSPAISLTFRVNDIPAGQQYSVKAFAEVTQTWVDLPTTYDPNADTITAQVSHFCCIALFSGSVSPPSTPAPAHTAGSLAAPSQAPPSTAVNIFVDMLAWVTDILTKNIFLLIGAAIFIVLLFFQRKKRRMDRIRYKL